MSRLLKSTGAKERMILSCIVETYLIALQARVSIFSANGNAILPYVEKEVLSLDEYNEVTEYQLPILIYNSIIDDGFPKLDDLSQTINELEEHLNSLKDNLWVKLMLKHYYENTAFTKEMLINFSDEEATEYGAARGHYNAYCMKCLDELKRIFKRKRNARKVIAWIADEQKAMQ
jgi:Mg2+ and Co2+ transporter CorA